MKKSNPLSYDWRNIIFIHIANTETELREKSNILFKAIPEKLTEISGEKITAYQVELVQKLWFNSRLSRSHMIFCNNYHNPNIGDNSPNVARALARL